MTWRATREIAAPAPVVWRLFADTRHWPAWGSTVRAVEPAAALVTPGLTGRVQTVVGVWVPFEVTSVEPGRSWSWLVAGIPATGHEIEATASGCVATVVVPRWAPFYVPVCAAALRTLEQLALDAVADGQM